MDIWHDHSTILHTGYILFAIWILYPMVFIYEEEYAATYKQKIINLQEIVEEPLTYMIAPSTSSPEYQLALVPDSRLPDGALKANNFQVWSQDQ